MFETLNLTEDSCISQRLSNVLSKGPASSVSGLQAYRSKESIMSWSPPVIALTNTIRARTAGLPTARQI